MRTLFKTRHNIITIMVDYENCLLFFLGGNGKSQAISFDDNMYYPRDDYYAVCDLLDEMVANNDIDEEDYIEIENKFVKYLKKELKDDEYITDDDIEEWRKEYNEWRKGTHKTAKEQLADLYHRLVADYNGDVKFEQHEEDRNIVQWYLCRG